MNKLFKAIKIMACIIIGLIFVTVITFNTLSGIHAIVNIILLGGIVLYYGIDMFRMEMM